MGTHMEYVRIILEKSLLVIPAFIQTKSIFNLELTTS